MERREYSEFGLSGKHRNNRLQNELLESDYFSGYKALALEREKMLCFLKMSMRIS